MKKLFAITFISLLLFLASCKSVINSPGFLNKTPDTLNKQTETVLANDTLSEIPYGTPIQTLKSEKIHVTLENDTVVTLESTDPKVPALVKPQEILLPKNTEVVLPENTQLITSSQSTSIIVQEQSKITLPQGTEITISKINWYAILFYCSLIFGAFWYYIRITEQNQDKNNDGYVDLPKKKTKI